MPPISPFAICLAGNVGQRVVDYLVSKGSRSKCIEEIRNSEITNNWSFHYMQSRIDELEEMTEVTEQASVELPRNPLYSQHFILDEKHATDLLHQIEALVLFELTSAISLADRIVQATVELRKVSRGLVWPKAEVENLKLSLAKQYSLARPDRQEASRNLERLNRWRADRVHNRHLYLFLEADPPVVIFAPVCSVRELIKHRAKAFTHHELTDSIVELQLFLEWWLKETIKQINTEGTDVI
jgi:hypothetical protein